MTTSWEFKALGLAFAAVAEGVRLSIAAGTPALYGVRIAGWRGDWCWLGSDIRPNIFRTAEEAADAAAAKQADFPTAVYVVAPMESFWCALLAHELAA